jgi:hypothetical protein
VPLLGADDSHQPLPQHLARQSLVIDEVEMLVPQVGAPNRVLAAMDAVAWGLPLTGSPDLRRGERLFVDALAADD